MRERVKGGPGRGCEGRGGGGEYEGGNEKSEWKGGVKWMGIRRVWNEGGSKERGEEESKRGGEVSGFSDRVGWEREWGGGGGEVSGIGKELN